MHYHPPQEGDAIRYANFSLTNNTTSLKKAIITDFKSDPIIDVPSDYLASVVRFDINARTIPVTLVNIIGPIEPQFLPPPAPPFTPNPNVGTYPTDCGVALNYLGVDYPQRIFWVPPTVPPPDLPLGSIFDYAEWLVQFNKAFGLAYTALVAAAGIPPGVVAPPYLGYDPNTQLISLYITDSYYLGVNPVTVWVNSIAYRYLASMPAAVSGTALPNFKDVELAPNIFSGPSRFATPAAGLRVGYPSDLNAVAGNLVQIPQQSISVSGWNVCRSIVLISPNLNVCTEGIPLDNASSQGASATNNFQSIVSDFLMNPDDNPVSARQTVVYLPTAEYRMFCLDSNSSIKQVDLQFFWNDFQNRQFPIYLAQNSSCSVKLMFRTRKYNGLK